MTAVAGVRDYVNGRSRAGALGPERRRSSAAAAAPNLEQAGFVTGETLHIDGGQAAEH
jgi:hypothetical protein